jgi:protein-tyrosine phosphatase
MTRLSPVRNVACAAVALALSAALTAPVVGLSPASAEQAAPRASAAGVIPFTAASLDAGKGKKWTLSWKAPKSAGKVAVYLSTDGGATYGAKPVAKGASTGKATISTRAARPWVKLVPAKGAPLEVANRVLGLATNSNFRDAGGYRTTDGRWVRFGLAYRSGALSLSNADAAAVESLGIVTDHDLRTVSEVAATPDKVLTGIAYVQNDVLGDAPGGALSTIIPSLSSTQDAEKLMHDMEITFVDADTAKTAYHDLFTAMADDDGGSLYHCSAGKDRTGWASEVLLSLLGVPQKTITADYLLSNKYYLNSRSVQQQIKSFPANMRAGLKIVQSVKAKWLKAGLAQVKKEYGTIRDYALNGLGLTTDTIAKLQAKFLVGQPTK